MNEDHNNLPINFHKASLSWLFLSLQSGCALNSTDLFQSDTHNA